MKNKTGFLLGFGEMILLLAIVFFSGSILMSEIENKLIILGLALFSAGILVVKKRIKMPFRDPMIRKKEDH
jgi:hypothetical protein